MYQLALKFQQRNAVTRSAGYDHDHINRIKLGFCDGKLKNLLNEGRCNEWMLETCLERDDKRIVTAGNVLWFQLNHKDSVRITFAYSDFQCRHALMLKQIFMLMLRIRPNFMYMW